MYKVSTKNNKLEDDVLHEKNYLTDLKGSKAFLYTKCPPKSYTGRRLYEYEIKQFVGLNTILNALYISKT